MSPNIKIAIIGAGPVSLTFANILQKSCIPFALYEAAHAIRHQGGSLDIHAETGQKALEKAGLLDQFNANARPESDCMRLFDVSGELLWDESGEQKEIIAKDERFQGRPEIDRAALTKILSENLEEGKVLFGKKLVDAVPSSESSSKKYDLHFADGTVEKDFDLVVGGDGAWSKVRPLVTDVKPAYSGISTLELWCNDAKNTNPWVADLIGPGMLMAMGEGVNVAGQVQGDGSIRTYASLRAPEDFWSTCGIDFSNPEQAKKELVEKHFNHIGDDLKRLVLESKDYLLPRTLYELPVGLTWETRPGVTLIGDAAHLMTPFAGIGVNVGMMDALFLAQEIEAAWGGKRTLDEAVAAYEKKMFAIAERATGKTMRNKIGHFRAGGAQAFKAKMEHALAEHAKQQQ